MNGIEDGKLTVDYPKIVEPFRDILHTEGLQANKQGLQLLFAHDFGHFARYFRNVFTNPVLNEAFTGLHTDVRSKLIAVLDELATDKLEPDSFVREQHREISDRAFHIAPFFRDYTAILFDSEDYLIALATSDIHSEEFYLNQLVSRRVPIGPIVSYYSAKFLIDDQETNDAGISIDGPRFITFYNLLTNAYQHRIQADYSVDLRTSDQRIIVTNHSGYGLVSNPKSVEAFWMGQYGLFIANLYADIAGLDLQTIAEVDGTWEKVNRTRGHVIEDSEILPRYKITAIIN